MDVFLNNKDLEKLYTTGESRKLKIEKQVAEKFFATIQKIESAVAVKDLLADRGLRFEKIKGTERSYSVRLSGKYRLEMEVEWLDDKKTIGKFFLNTISNHYGD